MTDPGLPSGSDRAFAALEAFDPAAEYDVIVNLQGDLPTIDPSVIDTVLKPLRDPAVDIATLVTEIADEAERHDPNAVKAVVGLADGETVGRALYFSRATVPTGDGPIITTLASTLIGARHCGSLLNCLKVCWKSVKSWSNYVRWKRGCVSMLRSLTPSRTVSILPPI